MTTNDEWVRERARVLLQDACLRGYRPVVERGGVKVRPLHKIDLEKAVEAIAAFGQEAIERGEIEGIGASFRAGQQSIIARLENPDEAMVEAVANVIERAHNDLSFHALDALRALARTLTEGQEGEGRDG